MRVKCPVVICMLSRMAMNGVSLRRTSRYSLNASLIITQMPGTTNSERPNMISRVLMAESTAKVGHRRTAMASTSRVCTSSPRLRASRNRISAAV